MKVIRSNAPTALALQDGSWFVSGGMGKISGRTQVLKTTESLTRHGGWRAGPDLGEERMYHCMAEMDNNMIMIAGGMRGKKPRLTKSAFILDVENQTVISVGELNKARKRPSCIVFDNKVVLVGRGSRKGETEIAKYRIS